MTLGQKINQLRTQKNLSQGDLADMLSVSRQSISKWETDGSVPDLDNLIKLSQIFNVTLDELVLNKSTATASPQSEALFTATIPESTPTANRVGTPVRVIIGAVLLICSFLGILICTVLGDPVAGMILMLPLMVGSLICFTIRKHTGLVFFWSISILSDIFLRWGTGINWHLARMLFRPELFSYGITIQMIVAIIEIIWLWALILLTVHRFCRGISWNSKTLGIGWGICLALNFAVGKGFNYLLRLGYVPQTAALFLTLQCLIDWGRVVLVTYLLIQSIRYITNRRSQN